MQNAGTLRKRTRRPLVKVNGLGTVPYSENEDNFKIREPYDVAHGMSHSYVHKTLADTRVDMMALRKKVDFRDLPINSARITRYPIYCIEHEDDQFTDDPPILDNSFENINKNHDRPYLLSKGAFYRLRIIIFLGMLCGNFPWIWNNKTQRIHMWNPIMVKLWKIYWYFTTIQSIGLIIYHIYCCIGLYDRNLESYRGIFAYFLIIYWYACHLGYKMSIYVYGEQMRKYFNLLQDFNKNYVDKYLLYADKHMEFSSARLIMKFSIPAASTQIVNSLFFFVAMPDLPFYLTSKINPRPWYVLILGAYQDLTMVGQTILTYITISWLQVAHTSCMEFWLREMHKHADTSYTSDELRQHNLTIKTYRTLQLLCTTYNDCMSPLPIPVWKFSVAFGFIPCGYVWIRSMNKLFIEEFPGILVYPFGTINCFTMGFGCLTMAAEMYDIANSFIYSWSRTKSKDFRRVLMSCPTLKVKVGRQYFITSSTTITFFQVMTGYIIDCIITFP